MSVSLLVSNVKVTGSNIIYNADLTGIGGAQVFSSGNKIFISGGAGGGGGPVNVSGYITTGEADARYYPLSTNPSGYVTGSYYTQDEINNFLQFQHPFFFETGASTDFSGYNAMIGNYPSGSTANQTFTVLSTNQFLTGFCTFSGEPDMNGSLDGTTLATIYAKKGASNEKVTSLYYKLFVVKPNYSTELITQSNLSIPLTDTLSRYNFYSYISGYNFVRSDRLALNWYADINGGGPNPNVTLSFDGNTNAGFTLPLTYSLLASNFYPLDSNPSGYITTGQVPIIKVTGSNPITGVNFSGLGGTQVIWSGNYILISGAGQGGSTVINTDVNLGFMSQIPSGIDKYYIGLQSPLASPPIIGLTLETQGSNNAYFTAVSGRSTTGFWALLSDFTTEADLWLNVLVQGTGIAISGIAYASGIPTGIDQYFFLYPNNYTFANSPKVNVTMETAYNNSYYGVMISGRTISGFWGLFSDIVLETGFYLNVIAKY
jgi:hypothetical protein